MITIEVDKKPAIFDHESRCSDSSDICSFIRAGVCISFCRLFLDKIEEPSVLLKDSDNHSIKCPECKEEWKIAKDKQPKLCPVCDKPRGMISDVGGGMVTPCPHCDDKVPF